MVHSKPQALQLLADCSRDSLEANLIIFSAAISACKKGGVQASSCHVLPMFQAHPSHLRPPLVMASRENLGTKWLFYLRECLAACHPLAFARGPGDASGSWGWHRNGGNVALCFYNVPLFAKASSGVLSTLLKTKTWQPRSGKTSSVTSLVGPHVLY